MAVSDAGPDTANEVDPEVAGGGVRAELVAASACGPVRPVNEDRLGWTLLGEPDSARSPLGDRGLLKAELHGDGLAIVIADGLGGHSHGELASRTAVARVLRGLGRADAVERIPGLLRTTFDEANSTLLVGQVDGLDGEDTDPPDDPDSSPPSTRGGQTTLTALAITGRSSHIAHVGDSRVYRLRDGLLELLTTDHTQVMELLRLRLVRPEQAARHPGRHLLTRSIGGDILVRTEARAGIPEPGDAYLLCTDGAWSSVSSGEIRAALEGDLAAGVSDLMACSAERGGDDNASVIALRVLQLGDDGRALRGGWRLPWQRRPRP